MSPQAQKPFVIPVFIPHSGCPHRCVFCNQKAITGEESVIIEPEALRTLIDRYLRLGGFRRSYRQIAFYGGNFLGLSPERIRRYLQTVESFVQKGLVQSIRFSTRPDTITDDRLDLIAAFPVATIELGVQSMDDRVLRRVRRGHTAQDTVAAVSRLKARQYEVGLQVMVGLPGEDEASCQNSGRQVAALLPDFVRIYPTVVLHDSLLAQWYREGVYTPLTLEEGIQRSKRLARIFLEKDIPIVRMGLQHTEDLACQGRILAGPYHPAFGERVYSELFFDRAVDIVSALDSPPPALILKVHPKSVSKMRGLRNQNIERLSRKFNIKSIEVVSDPFLTQDEIRPQLDF